MASKFKRASLGRKSDDCCAGEKCIEVDPQLAEEANDFAKDLYDQFKAKGYSDQDWADLEQRSGAEQAMKELQP